MSVLRPLLTLLRPHRRVLAVAVACGGLNQLAIIATAALGAYLVGRAAEGAAVADLRGPFVALAALVVPRALLPWAESIAAHAMAFRTLVDLRERVYRAVERLAPGGLAARRSGDLGAAMIGDVEQTEFFFAHTLSPLVVALTVPVFAVATLALFHWSLALVLLPVLVLMATVPGWMHRRAEAEAATIRERLGEANAEVVDSVQGLRELVSFGYGRRQFGRLRHTTSLLRGAVIDHARRSALERAAGDALVTLGTLVVVVAAASLVVAGAMPFALFPPAVVLAASSFQPMTTVLDVARDLNLVVASADRLLAIVDAPAPVADRATVAPNGPIAPTIRFDAVSFAYTPELPDTLSDVSFEIGSGETVALVGPSGAGKSTIAHLLTRFWDIREGAVTVGGHDVRTLPLHTLREQITFVPQDVYLFGCSVRENILMARPSASDRELRAAARGALAEEFIEALPEGYDSVVGERGTQLSGGQRQRIALARALLKNAPILVLDEAVSALDAESEQELAAAMARVTENRTTLVIAHRLSTIRRADRLVVVTGGQVVESGRHAQLVARPGGCYAALIDSQTFAAATGAR